MRSAFLCGFTGWNVDAITFAAMTGRLRPTRPLIQLKRSSKSECSWPFQLTLIRSSTRCYVEHARTGFVVLCIMGWLHTPHHCCLVARPHSPQIGAPDACLVAQNQTTSVFCNTCLHR
jgi:hypothetical protein